jgi:hypothetical protein
VAGNFQRYCFVPARDDDKAIRALEKVPKRWPRRDILGVCLSLYSSCQWLTKELVIIDIIKDKNPPSDLSILQPVPKELEDIRVAVLAPGDFSTVGKVTQTFLAARRVTRMNPENPGVRRFLPNSVAVFDSDSRFPVVKSALNGLP